jgi:hypothetical protein
MTTLDNATFTCHVVNADASGNVSQMRLEFSPAFLAANTASQIAELLALSAAHPDSADHNAVFIHSTAGHLARELQAGNIDSERLKLGVVLELGD